MDALRPKYCLIDWDGWRRAVTIWLLRGHTSTVQKWKRKRLDTG